MPLYLELLKGMQKLILDKRSIDIFTDGLLDSKLYQELQINDEKIQKQVIELLNGLNVSQHKSDLYTKLEQFKILEQQQILIKEDIQKLFIQLKQKQTYIVDQKEAAKIISDNQIKETSLIQNQIQQEETQGNQNVNQINMDDIRYMKCKLGTGEGSAANKIAKLLNMIRDNSISPDVSYYSSFTIQQIQLDQLKIWLCNHQFRLNTPNIIEAARQIFNSLDENKCQNYCSLIRLYYEYFKSRFRIYVIQNSTLGFQEQLDKTQQTQNFFDSLLALNLEITQIRSEIQILNKQFNDLEKEIELIRESQNLFEQQKSILEFSEFGNQKFNFLRYNLFAYVQKILQQQDLDFEIYQELAKTFQFNLDLNYNEILNSKSIYNFKDILFKDLTQTKGNQSIQLSAIYNSQSIITSLEKLNSNQNHQESWFSVRVLQIVFNIDQNGLIFRNNLDFIKIFSGELNKYLKGKNLEKLHQQKVFSILKFNGQNGSTLQLFKTFVELLEIPQFLEIFQYGEIIKLLLSELFINESIKPQLSKIDIGQIVNLMKYAHLDKILQIYKQNYLYFSKQQKYYEVVQKSIKNQNDSINNQLILKKQKDYNINFASNIIELIKSWQVKIDLISKTLFDQIEKMDKQSKQMELFKFRQSKGRNKPIFGNIQISDFDYLKRSPLNNRSEQLIYKVLMIFLGNDQFSQDSIKSILSSNKGYNKLKQIQAQDIQLIQNQQMDQIKTELIKKDSLELLNRNTKKLWKSIKKIDFIQFKNFKFEDLQNKQLTIYQQLKLFKKLHQFTVQLSQKDLKQIFDQVNQYLKQQMLEYSQIVNQNQEQINKIRSHKYNSKDVKQLLSNLVYLEEAKIIKYSQDLTNFMLGQSQLCDQLVIDFLLYFKNFSNIDLLHSNNKLGTILIYLDHYYLINEQQIIKTNNEICIIQQQEIQQILLYQNFMQNFNCTLNQVVGVYSYINLYQYGFKSTLQTIIYVEQQIDKSVDSIQSDLVIQIQIIYKIISKLIQKKFVLGVIADFLKQIQQIRQQYLTIYDIIKLNVQIKIELTQDINIDQFQKQISEILNIQFGEQLQLD